MKLKLELAAALALTMSGLLPAHAAAAEDDPHFDFTAKELVARINATMKEDGPDQIKACRKQGPETECTFTDRSFQQSVAGFKKLNVLNGRFNQDLKITISENPSGKVFMIFLAGTRADPVNLITFSGQVMNLVQTLDPHVDMDAASKMTKTLGLMRGDDDPSIGDMKNEITDAAEFRCNVQPSSVTMRVGCVALPRY